MRTWMCLICGFIYDEEAGRPEDGIRRAPSGKTSPNWTCPDCDARKDDFEMVEI